MKSHLALLVENLSPRPEWRPTWPYFIQRITQNLSNAKFVAKVLPPSWPFKNTPILILEKSLINVRSVKRDLPAVATCTCIVSKITMFEKHSKKSHSTLPAKRATFTFWVDKSSFKNAKNGPFWRVFLKTWSLRPNGITRQVTLQDKNLWKMPKLNSNATFLAFYHFLHSQIHILINFEFDF